MKKTVSKKFAIRLVAGLALIFLAVLFFFVLEGFTGPESTMTQRLIFIVAVFGLGLGGLGCIFFGIWGVLGGLAFVLVLTLPQALPDPWNRYFSIVYLLFLFAWKPVLKWVSQRKPTPVPAETAEESDLQDHDSFDLPGNSVVVTNTISGRSYQLFRSAGQISGYRVGGELLGINPEKLRATPGGNPDFSYGVDEIQKIRTKPHGMYGICVTCRVGGRTYQFVPSAYSDEEALEAFFRHFAPDQFPDRSKSQPATASQVHRRAMLSKIRTGLLVAIALIDLPWLFLKVPYKLFAVLSLIPCPVVLALICLFPEDTTLEEKAKKPGDRVEMITPLLFSGFGPCLRCLLDFNFLDLPRLLIYAAVMLIVIFVLVFAFNKPLRKKVGTLICTVLLCYFFTLGCIGQLNYLLDFSEPQSQSAEIIDMHVSTSSKGPDRYVLSVVTVDGTDMDLQVSKSEYQSLKPGDEVTVFILPGGLGIPYAFVG